MLIKYTGGETITATTKNVLCNNVVGYWFTGAVSPKGYSYTIKGIVDDDNIYTNSDFSYFIPIQNNSKNKFKTAANIYDSTHFPTYVWAYIKMSAKFDGNSWSDISEPEYVEVRQKVNTVNITSGSSTTYGNTVTLTYTVSPSNSYNKGIKFSISSGSNVISLSGNKITTLDGGTAKLKITSADGKYNNTYTFTVKPKPITLTANSINVKYDGAYHYIKASINAIVDGTLYVSTCSLLVDDLDKSHASSYYNTYAGVWHNISVYGSKTATNTIIYLLWDAKNSKDYNKVERNKTLSTKFIINPVPAVKTNPSAKTLKYKGTSQAIITAGVTSHGTFYYNTTASDSGRVTSVTNTKVKATNVGHYIRYWKFTSDINHTGSTNWSKLSCYIAKANQSAPTAKGATTYYPNMAIATATGGGRHGSLQWSNGNILSGVGTKTTSARWSGNSNYNASPYSNTVTLKVLSYYK